MTGPSELLEGAQEQERLIGSERMKEVMESLASLEYEGLVEVMPGFLPSLGRVLEARTAEIDEWGIEKGTDFFLTYLPRITEKMVSSDGDIKNELAMTEEMSFNLKAGNMIGTQVRIRDGGVSYSPGLAGERDFFIDIPEPKLFRIMRGQEDVMSGLMGGGIEMWREGEEGDMEKAQDLLPLVTLVLAKLKLDGMV